MAGDVCGVFRIGGGEVAVPLDALREVVPRPPTLDALPTSAPGLLGATTLREQVVPVVDLAAVLGREPADVPRRDQVVVVVAAGDGVLGLLADGVVGVASPGAALRPVRDGGVLAAVFRHPDTGTVVGLLDVAALVASGLPVVTRRAGTDAERDGVQSGRSLLLVRCGTLRLGLDITRVHGTLPALEVRASPLARGACRGVVDSGGVPLAVVDPLALLGLGRLEDEAPQSVSLRLAGGNVALLVGEVVDLAVVDDRDVLPLPPGALRDPDRFVGLVTVPGHGDVLVVDGDRLEDDEDLAALARIRTADVAAAAGTASPDASDGRAAGPGAVTSGPDDALRTADGSRRAPVGEALLAVDAGVEVVLAVAQVQEILPLPEDVVAGDLADPAARGFFAHRGLVVPLVDLAVLVGAGDGPTTGSAACVLVVAAPGGPVGMVVRRLIAMERSIWAGVHDADVDPGPGGQGAEALGERLLVRTVETGASGTERLRTRIDVLALAARLQARLGGTPTPRPAAPVPAPRDGADQPVPEPV